MDSSSIGLHRSSLLSFIVFIFSPFLALLMALWNIYKSQRGFFIIILFFTLLSTFYPPLGDSYRHYLYFNHYKDMSWLQFMGTLKLDCVVQTVEWAVANLGFKFEVVRLVLTFLVYSLIVSVWKRILASSFLSVSRMEKMIGFIIFMSCVFFLHMQGGMRSMFASAVFFSGAYYLLVEGHKKALLLVFLSGLIHFSFYPMIVAAFIAHCGIKVNSRFLRVATLILFLLIGGFVLPIILNSLGLSKQVVNHMDNYISGTWAGDFTDKLSFRGVMALYLGIVSLPYMIYLLLRYNFRTKIANLGFYMLCLLALSYPFLTIFIRTGMVIIPILALAFLSSYNGDFVMRRHLKILFIFAVLSYGVQLQSFKRQLAIADMKKIVYTSAPQILMQEYTQKWVHRNVNSDGSPARQ